MPDPNAAMTDTNIDTLAAADLPEDIRHARDECLRLGWIRMLDGDRFEITEKGRRELFERIVTPKTSTSTPNPKPDFP